MIAQNQVRITNETSSLLYTFDRNGHCDVRDGQGKWVAGGESNFGYCSIFYNVAFLNYGIDDQSLENYLPMHPELGQRLQIKLHERRIQLPKVARA